MPSSDSVPPRQAALRFGPSQRFELQPDERRLLVDGRPASLGSRAFDLLVALATRPDQLLTKSELLDRVWPGVVVEEANLQVQIGNLRKVLGGDAIATVPGRGYRFAAEVWQSTADTPAAAAATALPGAARAADGQQLIGRDDDLASLERLLQQAGCVTVVGPSGVGKTSLARVAAARWAGRCVWADLAALSLPQQVASTLARAFELQPTGGDLDVSAQLVAHLRAQTLLLVLDNAEHLVQACAELASMLRPLTGVHLLVTSQLPLAVAGERLLRLAPLQLPADHAPADDRRPDGALRLLIERITAADHRFVPTPAMLPTLRAICEQLDGLPLALEMAAARVPLLGLSGVHSALSQRFDMLTRGHRDAALRHRSLHQALAWSYGLLGPTEQRLFRALGVFAGGFSLELAVDLNSDRADTRWDLIDGLATLVDRSLVVVDTDDPPRYRLLETMRVFALEQLALGSGPTDAQAEEPAVRRRHAQAVLAHLSRHAPGDATTLTACLREMENARTAIAWASRNDLALAVQLSVKVTTLTTFTLWRHESGNWLLALEPLMEQPAGQDLPAELQATWWTERARIAAIRRDANASAPARRAVALWRPLQQPRQLLRATVTLIRSIAVPNAELDRACADLQAILPQIPDLTVRERIAVSGAQVRAAITRGDQAAVLAGRETEAALARQLGERDTVDAAESSIVGVLTALGRPAEAVERGVALLARLENDGGRSGNLPWAFSGLIGALLALGRADEARALMPRGLAACRRFATPALVLEMTSLAIVDGRFRDAAALIGYARAVYEARGIEMERREKAQFADKWAQVQHVLTPAVAQASMLRGRTLDDADAEALAVGHAAPPAAADAGRLH